MFLSYVTIILGCFLFYSFFVIYENKKVFDEQTQKYYEYKLQEISTVIDSEWMDANGIVTRLNASGAINNLYMSAKHNKTVDAYVLFQVINELKQAKAIGNNLNIYDTIIFFENYNRAYASSGVMPLEQPFYGTFDVASGMSLTTLKETYATTLNNSLTFNKSFLVYTDYYAYAYAGEVTRRGVVHVLFDAKRMEGMVDELLGEGVSLNIASNGVGVVDYGSSEDTERIFSRESSVAKELVYTMSVSHENFHMNFSTMTLVALSVGIALTVFFILISYFLTKRHYLPINEIRSLIREKNDATFKDMDDMLEDIRSVIGERNGYREEVVSISPYAQAGMIHELVKGSGVGDRLQILNQATTLGLKKPYYYLALINLAHKSVTRTKYRMGEGMMGIFIDTCQMISNEERQVACYQSDSDTCILIINSDEAEDLDELMYMFYNGVSGRMEDQNILITIGVDRQRDSIDELSEAYGCAEKALGQMLVEGRGSVFFFEEDIRSTGHDYHFPKDATMKLVKWIKGGQGQEIGEYLNEIYEKNIKDHAQHFHELHMLIDELHLVTMHAIRDIEAFNNVSFNIEKIANNATLREIFDYYIDVYTTLIDQYPQYAEVQNRMATVDEEIIAYMKDHFRNPDMSLSTISDAFGVSNKYVTMLCKRHCGKTYIQKLNELRIQFAIDQMASTKEPLQLIAKRAGYSNLLTFRRNFKSITGYNPSDYTNQVMDS